MAEMNASVPGLVTERRNIQTDEAAASRTRDYDSNALF